MIKKKKFEDLGIFGKVKTDKTYKVGDSYLLGWWGIIHCYKIEETDKEIIYYFND